MAAFLFLLFLLLLLYNLCSTAITIQQAFLRHHCICRSLITCTAHAVTVLLIAFHLKLSYAAAAETFHGHNTEQSKSKCLCLCLFLCVCVCAHGYSLHKSLGFFLQRESKQVHTYIEVPKDRDCFGFFPTKERGSIGHHAVAIQCPYGPVVTHLLT